MAITLDHTIVPAHDKVASAKFFARIFGLAYDGPMGPFAPVQINETLTFDFDDRRQGFEVHHYAFHVGEEEFDAIFGRWRPPSSTAASRGLRRTCMQFRTVPGGAHCLLPRSRPSSPGTPHHDLTERSRVHLADGGLLGRKEK